MHADHHRPVHDRVRQGADAGKRGHGEGGELPRLVLGAGDPQGGPVALVAGVEQAAQFLVLLGGLDAAKDGVGLVHQQSGRVVTDGTEDDSRAGVHGDQRVVRRLRDHVQQAGLAAPLRRPDHRQARSVLQCGLDVRGRHPQRDGGQRLATWQDHAPGDRCAQLVQQAGAFVGAIRPITLAG
ncbi:hypothetical protein OG790_14415 [Streptomyces cellulosae]